MASEATLGTGGVTALLAVQRDEGWTGQAPRSKNRAGRRRSRRRAANRAPPRDPWSLVAADAHRHADRGDPLRPPPDGSAVDVLVHLHGHRVITEAKPDKPLRVIYGTGYEDARVAGARRRSTSGVMQLEEQMSAAGRPLIGLLPQGSAGSSFGKAAAGFDLGQFVSAAFNRLTADKAWDADGSSGEPPTPGRAALSGHSGADQPITQMLSGGKANDLAGLFLFDTMYVTDAEKKAKAKLKVADAGQLEAAARRQGRGLRQGPLRRRPGGGPGQAARPRGVGERQGFRLSVVHAVGSDRYTESSDRLRDVVNGWIDALDPAVVGADAITAIRNNYVFKTAAKGKTHMEVMGDGNFAGAIAMLPLSAVTGAKQAPPSTGPPVQRTAEVLSAAGNRATARVLQRSPVAVQRDDAPVDHAAEFAAFNVRNAIEGGLEGYKGIREVFIATFGSIARANTYYAGVREMPFLGRSPMVHASTLGAKLAAPSRC